MSSIPFRHFGGPPQKFFLHLCVDGRERSMAGDVQLSEKVASPKATLYIPQVGGHNGANEPGQTGPTDCCLF